MPDEHSAFEKLFFASTLVTGLGSSGAFLYLLIIAAWAGLSTSFELLLLGL